MTASMTVPLQSSQALHRLVGPSAGGAGRRRGARQRTSDSVLRDRNTDVVGERSSARRRRNIRFSTSSPHLAAPPFTTGSHGIGTICRFS